MTRLDHLVVAALDLDEGARWLEQKLGAPLIPGGAHEVMGTHNRLLRLAGDDKLYLELIAVDPAGPTPTRPRWFALDDPAMRARLAERPRLIHWVARSDDIAREALPAHGKPMAMQRGHYHWRITVPADGGLPGDGLIPSLIEWTLPMHPAERLPAVGCKLMKLEGLHPAPSAIVEALTVLGLGKQLALFPGEPEEPPQLIAYLETPRGLIELD